MLKITPNLKVPLVYGYIKFDFSFVTSWVLDSDTTSHTQIWYVDLQQCTWTQIYVPKGNEPRDLSMKGTFYGMFKYLNLIF
jgi:hypothetical protein